jgi:hypothetical protein
MRVAKRLVSGPERTPEAAEVRHIEVIVVDVTEIRR